MANASACSVSSAFALPPTPPPKAEHLNIICDGCRANPLMGPRLKCLTCADKDFCLTCVARGAHRDHNLLCIQQPKMWQVPPPVVSYQPPITFEHLLTLLERDHWETNHFTINFECSTCGATPLSHCACARERYRSQLKSMTYGKLLAKARAKKLCL